ncbi:MAG: hypothetical protein ACJ71L_04835, partial [Nitrososphaeraceae archaeon]
MAHETNSTDPLCKEFSLYSKYFDRRRLDFIIRHLEEPIWPRTIFTKTLGKQKQITVYSRE